MPDVEIKRVGYEATAALSGLRWLWNELESRTPVMAREEFDRWSAEWLRTHGENHLPFLAVAGAEPVGMAWLAVQPRVPDAAIPIRAGGDLQSVFVVPDLRGQGIGRRLVDAIAAEARRLGLLHLSVRAGDQPLSYYEKLGFAVNRNTLELTL